MNFLSKVKTAGRLLLNGVRTGIFRQFDEPGIIIGGCGRSGTTVLLSILSAHRHIFAVPFETYCFCPNPKTGIPNPDVQLRVYEFYRELLSRRIPRECHRWCEKTPKNVVYFERILEHFGDAVRLVHIVRDGRDVITSSHPKNSNSYYVSPDRWIFDVAAGLALEDHAQVATVRYEDLVMSPSDTLVRLGEFLEEDFSGLHEKWYDQADVRTHGALEQGRISPLHARSVQRWKDSKYSERVDELMNRSEARVLLKELGYL